jgi:UPF0755 protein
VGRRLRWTSVAIVIVFGAACAVLYEVFFGPNVFAGAEEKSFFVSKGQTFASVVDSLEAEGIINSRQSFVFVAKFHGGTSRLKVGKYKFKSGISNYGLLTALLEGKDATLIPVTLREGLTSRQQAHILARAIGIDSARFVSLVHDPSVVQSFGITSPSLEGYLFPETYDFRWQADEQDIITHLVRHFQAFYNDSLQARASDIGWTTNQVMTLASIVEGEAVLPDERPIIAGVYLNRLRKGMKLEADPTIRFTIENGPRRILYSDLDVDNPYNTYRNKGLPPGPINNPGKASILAALFPTHHDYLFFVANGRGGHWFSSTFAEHKRNVRKYRRERRMQEAHALTESSEQRNYH